MKMIFIIDTEPIIAISFKINTFYLKVPSVRIFKYINFIFIWINLKLPRLMSIEKLNEYFR